MTSTGRPSLSWSISKVAQSPLDMVFPRIIWASCIMEAISESSWIRFATNKLSGFWGRERGRECIGGAAVLGVVETGTDGSAGCAAWGEDCFCPPGSRVSSAWIIKPVSTQYCMESWTSAGCMFSAAAISSVWKGSPACRRTQRSTLSCAAPANLICWSTREQGTAKTEFQCPKLIEKLMNY